jgi:hypothetical protein
MMAQRAPGWMVRSLLSLACLYRVGIDQVKSDSTAVMLTLLGDWNEGQVSTNQRNHLLFLPLN